ncbi:helix-turn-helix transcriptional regulator, partial [Nocardia farcinica]
RVRIRTAGETRSDDDTHQEYDLPFPDAIEELFVGELITDDNLDLTNAHPDQPGRPAPRKNAEVTGRPEHTDGGRGRSTAGKEVVREALPPAIRLGTTHGPSFDPIKAALTTAYTRTHNVGAAHPTAQALARMSSTDFRAAYEQLDKKARGHLDEAVSNVRKKLSLTIFHEKAIDALVDELQPQPLDRSGTLTDLQFTELRLAAEDVPSRQIADELGISERTVRAHLARIQY